MVNSFYHLLGNVGCLGSLSLSVTFLSLGGESLRTLLLLHPIKCDFTFTLLHSVRVWLVIVGDTSLLIISSWSPR